MAWTITPTEQWVKDKKWYNKKKPKVLAALLNNLNRYLEQLSNAKDPVLVQAGYIHPEPHGVVALDQKGSGQKLEETRMYLYPDRVEKVVYLITIGNKATQTADIQFCSAWVAENFPPAPREGGK